MVKMLENLETENNEKILKLLEILQESCGESSEKILELPKFLVNIVNRALSPPSILVRGYIKCAAEDHRSAVLLHQNKIYSPIRLFILSKITSPHYTKSRYLGKDGQVATYSESDEIVSHMSELLSMTEEMLEEAKKMLENPSPE